MEYKSYLQWMSDRTATTWWNDSGVKEDITQALAHGAVGVTTNPVLTYTTLSAFRNEWKHEINNVIHDVKGSQKAVALTSLVVQKAAGMLLPLYKESKGKYGYVCSQVSPNAAGNREAMLDTAIQMSAFAENVSVKLPATAAGLDVMEECISEGISVTVTVSFTLAQVLAIAETNRRGRQKAEKNGKKPGKCFAVVMIGRLDDYIRDIALDTKAEVAELDIQAAGLAVVKRAYSIYKQKGYKTELLIAAMRGNYHITDLAGADMILSIHPKFQGSFLDNSLPQKELIEKPVNPDSIKKLMLIPEFVKAYEPDGMKPEEFMTYGAVQRTLTQFIEKGWKMLEGFQV